MNYCIFKNNKYTGLYYSELNLKIREFHKEDLIVGMESVPAYKTDDNEVVIETLTLTDEEANLYSKKYKIDEIKFKLRDNKFVDTQMKCFSDGLVFAEKYPELAAERAALVEEINNLS